MPSRMPSPWSWELTAGEFSSYEFPRTGADCYVIAGSAASLAVPSLRQWRHEGEQSWLSPVSMQRTAIEPADAHARQMQHFLDIVRGRAKPLVSARDAARTLEVTLAVAEAARRHTLVDLSTDRAELEARRA